MSVTFRFMPICGSFDRVRVAHNLRHWAREREAALNEFNNVTGDLETQAACHRLSYVETQMRRALAEARSVPA